MNTKKIINPLISGKKRKRNEKAIKSVFFLTAIFGIIIIFSILFFLIRETYPLPTDIWSFLSGTIWSPTESLQFGTFSLTVGTLLVTLGAMIIAIPISIGGALFISEIASSRVRSIIKPAIELLAGIPSVVYGFFGLIILTTWIKDIFGVPTGETWLAGSIILGIMAIPTITTVAEDAIKAVPREFKEGSLAMGATKWQTIQKVIIPSALSGITAAIILGIGRAVGETMAILMVCGNAAIIPTPLWNIFSPIRTLTSTLGIETAEVPVGGPHYHALFGVAVLLLMITLIINITAVYLLGTIQKRQGATSKKKKHLFSITLLIKIKKIFTSLGLLFILLLLYLITGLLITAILVIIGGLLWFMRNKISQKNLQKIAFSTLGAAILLIIVILGIILSYIIINGAGALSWEFLTEAPKRLGREGGISTPLIGTLYLVAGAIAIALPIGVGASIYLTEYTKENTLTKIIRTGADLLNGTPSIVFGLFGFAFFVLYLKFGFSLIAGQITLAFMIIPTILRTTEEALRSVPQSLREGSYAVGATRWQTIRRVVLPPAAPGIITGAILGIGRAAGETAPIMFTAVAFSSFFPTSLLEPVNALPYHLFIISTNVPGAAAKNAAGGTALVLLLLVIGFYSIAILIRNHYQKTMKW
ncbi:MAG: phosphate ABC transporter permease PstA [Candidatus Thermoplasmatota archaeon]|nr:phosphate ABC transporter permease PstA [Candidatus Thermoplasmatota archaeon]